MRKNCYIYEKPCKFWGWDKVDNPEGECLAVWVEQCPYGKEKDVKPRKEATK